RLSHGDGRSKCAGSAVRIQCHGTAPVSDHLDARLRVQCSGAELFHLIRRQSASMRKHAEHVSLHLRAGDDTGRAPTHARVLVEMAQVLSKFARADPYSSTTIRIPHNG